MFTRFCMMQRLKSSFHDPNLPSEFAEFSALYRDTFEETDARGTRITDALAFEEHPVFTNETSTLQQLSPITYALLRRWIDGSHFRGTTPMFVRIHAKVKVHGATFASRNHSEANARVVFATSGADEWSAGSIKLLFTAKWTSSDQQQEIAKTFAVVNPYRALTESEAKTEDRFRGFGFAAGRLFYDTLDSESLIIPLDRIASHFGYTPWSDTLLDKKLMHAMPLNKVRPPTAPTLIL